MTSKAIEKASASVHNQRVRETFKYKILATVKVCESKGLLRPSSTYDIQVEIFDGDHICTVEDRIFKEKLIPIEKRSSASLEAISSHLVYVLHTDGFYLFGKDGWMVRQLQLTIDK